MNTKYRFNVHFRRVTPSEATAPGYLIPDEAMGVVAGTAEEAWQIFLAGTAPDPPDWYRQIRVPECVGAASQLLTPPADLNI